MDSSTSGTASSTLSKGNLFGGAPSEGNPTTSSTDSFANPFAAPTTFTKSSLFPSCSQSSPQDASRSLGSSVFGNINANAQSPPFSSTLFATTTTPNNPNLGCAFFSSVNADVQSPPFPSNLFASSAATTTTTANNPNFGCGFISHFNNNVQPPSFPSNIFTSSATTTTSNCSNGFTGRAMDGFCNTTGGHSPIQICPSCGHKSFRGQQKGSNSFASCSASPSDGGGESPLQICPICGHKAFKGQQKGSNSLASYSPTPDDYFTFGINNSLLCSISAMSVYEDKSHEELRWEDYQLQGKANAKHQTFWALPVLLLPVPVTAFSGFASGSIPCTPSPYLVGISAPAFAAPPIVPESPFTSASVVDQNSFSSPSGSRTTVTPSVIPLCELFRRL